MNNLKLISVILLIFFAISACSSQDENFGLQEENDETQERIFGGYAAKPGKFPWMVAIKWTDDHMKVYCTGFIADKRTILTAAHCIQSGNDKGTYTANVGNVFRKRGKEIKIRSAVQHPEYKDDTHDVAVLVTKKEIQFDENVQLICIENSNRSHKGAKVVTMGWGRTSHSNCVDNEGNISDKLMYHQQTVEDEDEGKIHTKGHGSETCEGDSGGPLVHFHSGINGHPVAIGILSKGTDKADETYTRISANLKFIKQYAKHVTFC